MLSSFVKETCHKDMLMFTALSLITCRDQWIIGQVYFDISIKYTLPFPPLKVFPVRKTSLLCKISLVQARELWEEDFSKRIGHLYPYLYR